jgi:hypothetical protein
VSGASLGQTAVDSLLWLSDLPSQAERSYCLRAIRGGPEETLAGLSALQLLNVFLWSLVL